jgi:hypothetical protein
VLENHEAIDTEGLAFQLLTSLAIGLLTLVLSPWGSQCWWPAQIYFPKAIFGFGYFRGFPASGSSNSQAAMWRLGDVGCGFCYLRRWACCLASLPQKSLSIVLPMGLAPRQRNSFCGRSSFIDEINGYTGSHSMKTGPRL